MKTTPETLNISMFANDGGTTVHLPRALLYLMELYENWN